MAKRILKFALVPNPRRADRSRSRGVVENAERILDRGRSIVLAAYELVDKQGLEGLTIRAVLE